MSGERWTNAEKRLLEDRWRRGETAKQIAFDLNKSVSSVKNQRKSLGLQPRRTGDKVRQIRVNVNEEIYRKMRSQALARGQPLSDYVRALIRVDIGFRR